MSQTVEKAIVQPMDEYNQALVANVHPSDWVNPEPASRYNLVVIGAGTAGLVVAGGAGLLGSKVALIEKDLMGGDCLNVGCVPSKCMIRSSRVVGDIQNADKFGIHVPDGTEINFSAVMERMRRVRAEISPHDSAQRFKEEFNVDVFLGEARFNSADTVEVGGKILRFKKAVIATGAKATAPDLEGLKDAGYLTNETVFSLTERPQRMAIIGAGPLGCEFAQTFQRLGSQVLLIHKNDHILDKEDADAAEIVQQAFIREGVQLILNSKVKRVERTSVGKVIYYESDGKEDSVTVDEILIGVGRSPNVKQLNLEAVGVQYDMKKGVIVNDKLQTSNPRIYAAGDVCMDWKFTHAADAAARIVIQNSLFFGCKKLSSLTMPWVTYTDPEVAHVGMYEKDAQKKGIEVDTFFVPLNEVDRAVADGETAGFAKVFVNKGTDKILGATIVARNAGDMISEVTLAIVGNLGLKTLGSVIHPYPTQAEVIRKAADEYSRTRLTPFIKKLLSWWLAWTR
ncbi:mercuric reductase [Funiculus sociatus GB2-A5]|uniref:Mercuric reductase n=1 Tax=Funiculus sociatus GB2-A5 TaxID=2933946 RepID=A0ABV0JU08_9CYAN|nr:MULTISPECIES: mercuric reductase [unclassified Trichocoleus]MBD1905056.1 mercuric reductase [Trichocoleus sp. FACHB-832]MBD2062590.1 mercuric reductase [Trichocoleus sp. FACHB-6]